MTLKEFREKKGWSQARVAELLTMRLGRRIGQSHVSGYENGVMPPWDVGEAITRITSGQVKVTSIKQGGANV